MLSMASDTTEKEQVETSTIDNLQQAIDIVKAVLSIASVSFTPSSTMWFVIMMSYNTQHSLITGKKMRLINYNLH